MSEATFTFRVDRALKEEFSDLAKANDRSAAQLLRDFMRDYIQRENASDAQFDGVREEPFSDYLVSNEAIEQWLKQQVVAAAEVLIADPSRALSIDEVRSHLAAARAKKLNDAL